MTAKAPPHQTRLTLPGSSREAVRESAAAPCREPAGTKPLPLRLDSTRRFPDGSIELAYDAK